ncbi:glycosyltransferase family 39 protein [bacterium]|nr:glycosyltransferase family 39 protein [candidate division CSSED10-310 bacterium]
MIETGIDRRTTRLIRGWAPDWMAIAAPVFAALFMRLLFLGTHPMWYDEAMVQYEVKNLWVTLSTFLTFHPPLFIILAKPFHLVSLNEWCLRLPSALFGTIAVWLTVLLGRRLMDARTGFYAGMFLAFSPFHIFYSQQFRPNSLLSLMAAACLLVTAKLIIDSPGGPGEPRGETWRWFAVTHILLLYTHFFGVLLLAAEDIAILLTRKLTMRFVRRWLGTHLIIIASAAPLITLFRKITTAVTGVQTIWIEPITWRTPFNSFKLFNFGFYLVGTRARFAMVLVGCILLIGLSAMRRQRRELVFLAATTVIPPAVPMLASLVINPIYLERSLVFILVPYAVLLGRGLARIPPRLPAVLAMAPLVLLLAGPMWAQYNNHQFPCSNRTACARIEAKQAVNYIRAHWHEGDFVGHNHIQGYIPFIFYMPIENQAYLISRWGEDQIILGGFTYPVEETERAITLYGGHFDLFDRAAAFHSRLWLVFTRPGVNNELSAEAHWMMNRMAELGWTIADYQRFMGIELYLYQPEQ